MEVPAPLDDPTTTWNRRPQRVATMAYGPTPSAPSSTRSFVRSTARAWGLGDVGAVAELLVSEVVTNAVEHGATGGTVRVLALPSGLRVEVSDSSTDPPRVVTASSSDPSGRGLSIVDHLARWWGVAPTASGKVVWFEVDDVDTG